MVHLSVVIPALDDAELLADCLAALAAQTRVADEIIVVDNGSTDNTALVAATAGCRVVTEPRRGILIAASAGFDAAHGDLLARLDADSVPPVDWLERIEQAFAADPGLAALTGPGDFYGSGRLVAWIGSVFYLGAYFRAVGLLLGHPALFGSNLAMTAGTWARLRTTVHRDVSEIHDDMDMAFAIEPDMRVRFDNTLRVGISARPFASLSAMVKRGRWGFITLALNRKRASPIARRVQRRAAEQVRPASAG